MNRGGILVIEGSVVAVESVAPSPIDRPRWVTVARLLSLAGLTFCAAVAATLGFLVGRRAGRHRGERAFALGAVGGFLIAHRSSRTRATHSWRLQTNEGLIVARMAAGDRVDGLVSAGDELALRGRFARSGVFCAYRGINHSAGLELVPRYTDATTALGVAVALWIVAIGIALFVG